MKALAALLRLRLRGVAMDGCGMLPDAFEAACRQNGGGGVRAVYLIPTLQNPTGSTMPGERRQDIVDIARRYGVTIVEDDVYGFLSGPENIPLQALAPERTFYLTSASKCWAPSLRIGWLVAPPGLRDRAAAVVRASMWMASPLMGQLAARWIADGTGERLVQIQAEEARERQHLARQVLPTELLNPDGHEAFHLWLTLPEPWRALEFATEARRRGVLVTPADAFAVGRDPAPHAVRICLQAVDDQPTVLRGVRTLARLLEERPAGLSIL